MDMRTDGTKQKKRLPLFDIALLLLLAVAVTFGFYWAARHKTTEAVELIYTVRFLCVEDDYGGAFEEEKTLYTKEGVVIGSILEVAHTRSAEQTFNPVQAYVEGEQYSYDSVPVQGKSDVLLTVRVTAEVRNGGYFVNGIRIASGTELDAMVEGYLGHGAILTVEKAEATAAAEEVSE